MKKIEKIEKIKEVVATAGYTITDTAIKKLLENHWNYNYKCGLMVDVEKKEIYFGDGLFRGNWLQSRCGDKFLGSYRGWKEFVEDFREDMYYL